MIADLKPYSAYEASGIPWAHALPSNWRTERAKWLFTKMSRPVRPEDEVVTCFRDGIVTLRKNRRLRGFTEATFESCYQGIRKGDLVIHGMDAFAGAIGVSDSDGKGTPVYNVCKPQPEVTPQYYAYAIREMSRSKWILALAKGIRERSTDFRFEMFGNQRVPLPPHEEQEAIVRFLDWANGRLERAIRAKRKVIALLKEQKQAIIHRAVTRGLDPSVPLKPSGIPWLGEIPQHWQVLPFVRCTVERADYRGATPEKVETGVFLVTAKNVRKGWIDYSASKEFVRRSEYAKIMRRGLPRVGDILLTMEAPLGHVALIDQEDIALAQRIIRFRVDGKRLLPRFALHAMNSQYFQDQLHQRGTGSTAQGLKASKLSQLRVCLPPVEEQLSILGQLEDEYRPVDAAIARFNREVELISEYRSGLIADVVTGKLDVREAAAVLPGSEEPEDSEGDEAGSTFEEADEEAVA